jgi:hypothetical protein
MDSGLEQLFFISRPNERFKELSEQKYLDGPNSTLDKKK